MIKKDGSQMKLMTEHLIYSQMLDSMTAGIHTALFQQICFTGK